MKNAGAVDRNIDRAHVALKLGDRGFDRGLVGHVHSNGVTTDVRRHCLGGLMFPIGDECDGATRGHQPRAGFANAARATCYQAPFTGETERANVFGPFLFHGHVL